MADSSNYFSITAIRIPKTMITDEYSSVIIIQECKGITMHILCWAC
jgi:hypothetical protein